MAIFTAITFRGELKVQAVPQDTIIWYSQFNGGATNDVPDWSDDPSSPAESVNAAGFAQIGSGSAIVRPGDATVLGGLEALRLEYDLGWQTTIASPGSLVVEWRVQGSPTWLNLRTTVIPGPVPAPGAVQTTPAPVADIDLPAAADGQLVEIRFGTTITEANNWVRLDDIRLSGKLINTMVDTDGDGVFDQNDQCANTPGDEVADSRGCSVQQYIGMLPGYTANGGYSDDICAEANFSLVIDTSNSVSESPELGLIRSELTSFISAYASGDGNGQYEITTFNDNATNPRGAGYEASGPAAVTIGTIETTVGETNTAAGIATGDTLNANTFVDDVMFIVTDGSANLPNPGGLPASNPFRWVTAATQAINAAEAARSAGFVVNTVFVPSIDSDMITAFNNSQADALLFANEVMRRMGGGSFTSLTDFSGVAESFLASTGCAPVFRDLTIQKVVAGDTPPTALTSVGGSISNYGAWTLDTVPGSTTLTDVSGNVAHVVSETSPGEGWSVEYQLASSAQANCSELESGWSTDPNSAQVPADENDYRVCIRNTYTAEPEPVIRTITIEKVLAGDEPVAPVASVSGTIGNHSPGDWIINNPPGSVDIEDVSADSHLITENGLGAGWQTEYGIADSAQATCDSVNVWSEEPILVPAGESDVKICILNTFFAEIPTRTIVIEKVLAGDDAALASVSGTISGHSPSSWSINSVPGSTSIMEVSVEAHTVTENNPGAQWTVEYALAASPTASCTGLEWSTTPATVPAGEEDARVCIRNTFTELPEIEKVGVAYDIQAGQARWDITITNPSQFPQSVTIVDPIAVNIVGGTPDGCSGSLAGGLTCTVAANSQLTFTVFKMVTQQCGEQTVINSASAFINGETPIAESPQEEIPTLIPGNVEFCEDLTVSKIGVGWFSGMAGWAIILDNSESGLAQSVILNDPGAVAEGNYPACGLEDGDPIINVECELEVGDVLTILVETNAPATTCGPRVVENILTANSTRGEPSAQVTIELEYEIFALLTVPGNPEFCPPLLTVKKYIDADGDFPDLINGPQPPDALINGWEITLVCAQMSQTVVTGSDGPGTASFFGLQEPLTNCTLSEELRDGYQPVGFYRMEDEEIDTGTQVTGIDIELSNGDHDFVYFFNRAEEDETPTPSETPSETATATPTSTGTVTATPTGTPTDDGNGGGGTPSASVTPGAPSSGSGFGLGGPQGAVNMLFALAGLLVVAGGASLFAMSRRR